MLSFSLVIPLYDCKFLRGRNSKEYYSAIKKNSFESVLMRWMKLEPIIQSEVSQKDKDHYNLTHLFILLSALITGHREWHIFLRSQHMCI